MIDAEAEARWLLESVGFSLDDVPGARKLVFAHLGEGSIERVAPRLLRGAEASIVRAPFGHRIYVSTRLSRERQTFAVLHELAHWKVGVLRHGDDEVEAACDAIAGALTCPRRAFQRAVHSHGLAWSALATGFGTDATCIALRYGEVFDVPLAVVSPRLVRVRGPEWGWPANDAIRALARRPPPELRVERLPDDPKRLVLLAA